MTGTFFTSPDTLDYFGHPYSGPWSYAGLPTPHDDSLDLQENPQCLARSGPHSASSLNRIDSASASRSSTVPSFSNRSGYGSDNTTILNLDDGLHSYPEYVPQAPDWFNLQSSWHYGTPFPYSVAPIDVERNSPEQSHTDGLECPQGCGSRLACKPNVKRHLKEQHQCPHLDCTGMIFRTKLERDKHKETHVEDGLGFQCGSCGLKGLRKRLARPDKLRDHFFQVHEMPDDFAFKRFQCMDPSCHPGSSGGTFFTSRSDLELHTRSKHLDEAGGALSSDTENSILSRNASRNMDSCKKHYLSREESLPQPKRFMSVEARVSLSDPRPSSASLVMTVIEPIKILDFCNLVGDARLPGIVRDLNLIKVSAVFIRSTMAIQLCGAQSSKDMERAKTLFGALLPAKSETLPPTSHARTRKISRPRLFDATLSIQLLPIDASQNKDAIETWDFYIVPALNDILKESRIGDSYSATLVRQKGSLGEFEPVIRIQSASQFQIMRDMIRKRIDEICAKNNRCAIPIVFSKGKMVPLVGGQSKQRFAEDPSDDRDIPHELRYYQRPGMSVSIGMTQCGHASATLGGFILVDKQTVMLTVQHLIKSARNCDDCGAKDLDNSLSSPARSDVENLRDKLEMHLKKLTLMLQNSDSGTDRVDLNAMCTQFPKVIVHARQIESFHAQLKKPIDDYKLGKVIDCSDENDIVPTSNTRGGCGKILQHRMDWAIYEIQKEREGKNRFRHRVGDGTRVRIEDIEKEITNPYGTGQACEDWKEFEVGDEVYYVGSCSGYREGIINGSYSSFQYLDDVLQEWTIVPSISIEDEDEVQGDSGAWIISKSDDKLIGLLWGYFDGTMLFTPISEVFKQIAKKRGGSPSIKVAPLDPARAIQPKAFTSVCRMKRTNSTKTGLQRNFTPLEIRSLSVSRSPSPTPSLNSSVSTLSDPISPSIRPLNFQFPKSLLPFEKLELPIRSFMSPYTPDPNFSKSSTQIGGGEAVEIV